MIIENTIPGIYVSLFSVDGNAPVTGGEIIEANADERELTIETLTTAYHRGFVDGGANGADVRCVLKLTDRDDDDLIHAAAELKAGWDGITEIDDDDCVSGPSCDSNYVWRIIDDHAYLVFDSCGLCGINASTLIDEYLAHNDN